MVKNRAIHRKNSPASWTADDQAGAANRVVDKKGDDRDALNADVLYFPTQSAQ
jgi:hypothetical protein